MINCNYRFCSNYFFILLSPPTLLFYRNNHGTALVLLDLVPSLTVAKTVIIINRLAARAKSGSLWNCKILSATKQ